VATRSSSNPAAPVPKSGKTLKVVYHEDHSTDVLHTRGAPVICKDCRHSGWLTQYDFKTHTIPTHCLFYSGGADPRDGDRIILDWVDRPRSHYYNDDRETIESWDKLYPKCFQKNQDGQCGDYVRALETRWIDRLLRRVKRKDMRK